MSATWRRNARGGGRFPGRDGPTSPRPIWPWASSQARFTEWLRHAVPGATIWCSGWRSRWCVVRVPGFGDVGHGGGERLAGMEAPRSGDRQPREHSPGSCPGRSLRTCGLAVLIWLPGRSHGHDRATRATAPDTSAEASLAIIITRPGEIVSAREPVRLVRSGLYSAAGGW